MTCKSYARPRSVSPWEPCERLFANALSTPWGACTIHRACNDAPEGDFPTSLTASTHAACFTQYPREGKSGNVSKLLKLAPTAGVGPASSSLTVKRIAALPHRNLGGYCEGRVSRSPSPMPGACLILCHQPITFTGES